MIAQIIINSNAKDLNRIFDYEVPTEMIDKIKIGKRVLIPFGRMKSLEEGFVIGFRETSEYKTKSIAKIEDEDFLSEEKIKLAKWMARRYFCNISDCLKLMLPPGTTTKKIESRVKEKTSKFVYLKKDKEEIEYEIENGNIKSSKQLKVLNFLIENDDILISDLEIFTDTSKAVIKTLEKNGYVEIIEKQTQRNPFMHKVVNNNVKLELTEEQKKAYEKIEEAIDDKMNSDFLIFGVTGSRKNRNLFATNRKSIKRRKRQHNASSRNIANATNGG